MTLIHESTDSFQRAMDLRRKIIPHINALADSSGWTCPTVIARALKEPNEPIGMTVKRIRRQFRVFMARGAMERTRVGTWKLLRKLTEDDIPFKQMGH